MAFVRLYLRQRLRLLAGSSAIGRPSPTTTAVAITARLT